MQNVDLHFFFHGVLILFIGLVGGFPFASAIKKQNGKETSWRVVHSGSSMAGIMLISLGAMFPKIEAGPVQGTIVFIGITSSTYLFVIAMVAAAITGERGIGYEIAKKNTAWKGIYYLYGIAAVLSVISFGYLLMLCFLKLYW